MRHAHNALRARYRAIADRHRKSLWFRLQVRRRRGQHRRKQNQGCGGSDCRDGARRQRAGTSCDDESLSTARIAFFGTEAS